MRVYVSSTFEDLREHRAAAVQVLRQLGHEVHAMEDYVAESSVPLGKVLEDVETCDALVEIVAWRYGYVPPMGPATAVAGATAGKTSITEYEYRQACEKGKPVLAFLLDERAPWPAHLIDGVRDPRKAGAISAFRAELQRNRLVAFFTSPDSLASRVAAAVGAIGMRTELRRQLLAPESAVRLAAFSDPTYLTDSHLLPIVQLVSAPRPAVAATIDIATTWWSTRLYLLAAIGETLGALRRIVIVEKEGDHERFIGMISTSAVGAALRRIHPEAEIFDQTVLHRPPGNDVGEAARRLLEQEWSQILGAPPGSSGREPSIALAVNPPNLRLWFGDSLLDTPVRVEDLESVTAIDLLRILDYPNDFVPVIGRKAGSGQPIQLVNKRELAEGLARNSIVEMLDRLGIR